MRNLSFTRWHYWALCTLLIVLGVQGFENGNVNNFRDQSIQLPVIYSYNNPALFQGDFLLDARESYVTWFYPALGVASRAIPLAWLMVGLYVLSVALTVSAVYTLAETLFPRHGVGPFAVILWMAYLPNPGGDFTHSPFVTHTTFAIAIELWALVLIWQHKYFGAAVLLGLAANINAMTSFFVGFMWLCAMIGNRRLWSWHTAAAFVVMALLALPIFVWRFSLPLTEASLDEFVSIIRLRLWYAVFPFSISWILWAGFFALLILWRYSFRYGRPENHAEVTYMAAGIAALCIIGTVFTEIIPVEFVIELQLIRCTWLLNLFVVLYLAHMLRELLSAHTRRATLSAYALLATLIIPRWVIEFSPPQQPTPYPLYIDLDPAWATDSRSALALICGLSLLALLPITAYLVRQARCAQCSRRVMAWVGFAVAGLILPVFVPSHIPDEQRIVTSAWHETLTWIEGHTSPDASFVTPPMLDGFRVQARRPYLGDWKDGTVGIFHNGWAIEWYERMLDLGFDEDSFSFLPLTQERLCGVAEKYDLDYAVVFRESPVEGSPVFENETFMVLPVESLNCSLARQ